MLHVCVRCAQARYDDMQKKTTAAQNDVVRLTAERNTLQHRLSQIKVGCMMSKMDTHGVCRANRRSKNA